MIDPSLSQKWWIWWIMNYGWKIMKSLAYRGDHSANTIQKSVFKCIKLRKDAIVDLWISCVLSLTKKLLTQIDWVLKGFGKRFKALKMHLPRTRYLQQSLEASLRKTEVGLSAATSLTPNNPVLESLLLLSHDVHPPLILCSHLFLPGLKVSLLLRARKVWTYALSSTAIEVKLGVWKGYWLMQCHNPSTRMSHIGLHERVS